MKMTLSRGVLITCILALFLMWLVGRSYGQTFGGKIAFGGKPAAALVVGAPSCTTNVNVNSIAVGVTATGQNRMFLGIAQFNRTAQYVVGMSNGTQNFSFVGEAATESIIYTSVWRLIAPTLGTQTITTPISAEVGAVSLCILSFENVNQSIGTQNLVAAGSGSNAVNLTTSSAVGNVVISAFVSANNAVSTADDTLINTATPGSIIVTRIGQKPGAATVNVTMGLAGTNAHNELLIDVVRAP